MPWSPRGVLIWSTLCLGSGSMNGPANLFFFDYPHGDVREHFNSVRLSRSSRPVLLLHLVCLCASWFVCSCVCVSVSQNSCPVLFSFLLDILVVAASAVVLLVFEFFDANFFIITKQWCCKSCGFTRPLTTFNHRRSCRPGELSLSLSLVSQFLFLSLTVSGWIDHLFSHKLFD